MTDQPAMRCGNDPRARLTPDDQQAVQEFKAYLAARRTVEAYEAANQPRPPVPPVDVAAAMTGDTDDDTANDGRLRPRSERCPDPHCTDNKQCWRCDYEEGQATRTTPDNPAASNDEADNCPGYETEPNRCTCGCEGCTHHCAAHHGTPAASDDDLRERYAAAIEADAERPPGERVGILNAVLAVRDRRLEQLTGELAEARERNAYLEGYNTRETARRKTWHARAEQAEAVIARVRTTANRHAPLSQFETRDEPGDYEHGWSAAMDAVERALDQQPTTVSAPDVEADNEQLRQRLDRIIEHRDRLAAQVDALKRTIRLQAADHGRRTPAPEDTP